MKNLFFLFLLLVFVSLFTNASGQTTAKTGTVNDMQFIVGHWKATQPDGRTVEGTWLAPDGENMLGMMRMMKDSKIAMYEILAYEQTETGLVSLVKHFKPGLLGQEEKDKQDRYIFLEAGKNKVYYQKEGDAMRILYEKRSANQFVILRGNQLEGKWVYKDLFVFNRVK